MSTMGVGSNNSHWSQTNDIHLDDHEFEVDEEGEGIVEAPKGRAGNYTTNDDKLLCNTWLQVSRDPSVGGDQSRDAYWGRMKEHFDAQNVSGIDRSERSLRSRWSTINSDCQKWAAAQKAVDKLNPSGTNEDDRVSGISYMFIILVFGVRSANFFCFSCSTTLHKTCSKKRRGQPRRGRSRKERSLPCLIAMKC